MTAGCVAGMVSTVGYKVLGGKLYQRLGVHDTCGVGPGTKYKLHQI